MKKGKALTFENSKIPNPCLPDCEKRTANCHSSCNRYKVYCIAKNAERKKKARDRHAENDYMTHITDRSEKFRKGIIKDSRKGRKR